MKKSFAFNNRKGQKIELLENKHKQGIFEKGIRNIKDLLAPAAIYRNSPDDLEIDGLYSRSFVINGYPNSTYVGCLRDLFDYEVDMDVAIYIEPADERSALMELTAEITKAETQLRSDKERGKIDNITVLEAKINKLVQQRIKLEQNIETMFYCAIFGTLYESSIGKLNKEMQKLDNKLIGNRIKIMPLYLRQDDAYKTVLPYGKCYINDFFRNINTGALTGIFPFYNAEISHPNGTFMGINIATATPIYLDWYNKNYLDNANGFLFGKSGSGKTYLVSLLTLRSCIDGIHTAIIDVESEYGKVTRAVGGIIVKFEPMEKFKLNFFDIEAEEVLSDDGMPTGSWIVNIKDKCANALNLIAVMSQGLLTPDMQSGVSYVLMKMYSDFNITENPDSLYESLPGSEFDEKTGKFRYDKFRKKMPQMTDFYNGLLKYAKETNDERFYKLADSMKIFVNGGIYDMFDCQTTMDIDFMKVLVITFDVSKLEENLLRPIGMYIALNWIWEKFAKKDVKIKKRILVDEAWMLIRKGLSGSEYTAHFLENSSARIRKRNGGLVIASQRFGVFSSSEQGQAILTNATVKMFLKQDPADIKDVQNTFLLSNGEKQYLLGLKKGEYLLKVNNESSKGFAYSFDFEDELIGNPELKKTGYVEDDL